MIRTYGVLILSSSDRLALTAFEGLVVYDLDAHGLFYYDGTNWVST